MYNLIAVIAAVVPAIFLVIYYYRKDKVRPEPKGMIIKVFIFGILSIVPAVILEQVLSVVEPMLNIYPIVLFIFDAFIVAALCEEWIKLKVVKWTAYKTKSFDEISDGIIYAVMASLGFACLENVLYVLGNGLFVALVRAFTSVPMHAIAAGHMGYYIGKAKFAKDKAEEKAFMRKGLLIAVGIHGLYDFVLFAIPVLGLVPVVIVLPVLLIVGFKTLNKLMKKAIAEDSSVQPVSYIENPVNTGIQ